MDSLTTYHIIVTSGKHGQLEIRQDGRTVYRGDRKSHLIHSEELRLLTPTVDGSSTIASAKLKPNPEECRLLLGVSEHASKTDWQRIVAIDSLWTMYRFEYEGRQYLWKTSIPPSTEAKDIAHKLLISNMVLVDESEQNIVLARYHRESEPSSDGRLVGKIDIMTKLGPKLETLSIISVLGLRECAELDHRTRNLPVAKGPTPYGLGAAGGMSAGHGGGGGGGGC